VEVPKDQIACWVSLNWNVNIAFTKGGASEITIFDGKNIGLDPPIANRESSSRYHLGGEVYDMKALYVS
jgi:hypothetical protein